ncbi:G-protein coupled receptor GRL101-like [Amphiura filiformis]|uniref:G-protein coupled receptor GRL101-like n=1 Tax=Amphiura filiformis TaxID=82378 RepID=UPI003B20FFE4
MCGRLMQNTVLSAFMWILGLSALVGNFFALIWRMKEKTKSPMQFVQSLLIANLAMSDFLMGVYMVIIASTDAHYGDDYFKYSDRWRSGKLCRFAGFLSLLSSETSVFFLTLISVDRFVSVVFPFSRFRLTKTSVKLVGGLLWGFAFVISVVPVVVAGPDSDLYDLSDVCIGLPLITRPTSFALQESEVDNQMTGVSFALPVPDESKPAWFFSIAIFLGLNLICFLLILLCYIGVFVSLRKSSKRVGRKKSSREEEVRVAIKMAIIIGTDFMCWMPVILMGIFSQTGIAVIPLEAYTWCVVFILPINSSLNPYLYTITSIISKRNNRVSPSDSRTQDTELSAVTRNRPQ